MVTERQGGRPKSPTRMPPSFSLFTIPYSLLLWHPAHGHRAVVPAAVEPLGRAMRNDHPVHAKRCFQAFEIREFELAELTLFRQLAVPFRAQRRKEPHHGGILYGVGQLASLGKRAESV